jgi:multiple sugar transport system ATP-binding protein
MNFIDATIRRNGGLSATAPDGSELPLPPDAGGRDGQKVVYGIRPEHLDLTDGPTGLAAEVVVVEPTGAEILVFTHMAGQEVAVVFKERHKFRPGDKLTLTPHAGTIHLFDKETGARIET